MDRWFDLDKAADDFWQSIADLRGSQDVGRAIEFVKLGSLTSNLGDLGGLRVFSRTFPWRKEFAEVLVARDCGYDDDGYPNGFSIKVMKVRHEEVRIFDTGNSLDEADNLNQAVTIFSEVVKTLVDAVRTGNLRSKFPTDWVGRHWRQMVKDDLIQPRIKEFEYLRKLFFVAPIATLGAVYFLGGYTVVSLCMAAYGVYLFLVGYFNLETGDFKATAPKRNFTFATIFGLFWAAISLWGAVILYDPIKPISQLWRELIS